MMIAVVVDAIKPGVTGWAAVRSSQELVVRGLDDGELKVEFDGGAANWRIFADQTQPLPPDATRVKVEIVDPGNDRVFVDLE